MYTGRLAPSPTGLLHLGHAATFLIAHQRARAANGHLLLRIDDLDPQRSEEAFVEAAREDLHWLGLTWDAELRDSDQLDTYRKAMETLLAQGHAYPCTCTRKDLLQATQAPHEDTDDEPVYNGHCRPALHGTDPVCRLEGRISAPQSSVVTPSDKLQPGMNYRFHLRDGEVISFPDSNCGPQTFTAGADFGDFLVWRKDGLPSYQLASVLDDAHTQITEVVRGRDLLKSTARQILLQRALHLGTPAYFHTDLLLDDHGQRLAKRHDALSLRALRDTGVTPAEIRARVDVLWHHRKM